MVLMAACPIAVSAVDDSEAGVPVSPLKRYSGGAGFGAMMSLNGELQDVSHQFLIVSFVNSYQVRERIALFFDVDWLIPNYNVGADIGVDFVGVAGEFHPFAGIGFGARHIDGEGDFGDNFGPSFTAHVGFTLDLADNLAVRMRLPYHVVLNERRDHFAGVDIAFLFSSRFKKVGKLNYN